MDFAPYLRVFVENICVVPRKGRKIMDFAPYLKVGEFQWEDSSYSLHAWKKPPPRLNLPSLPPPRLNLTSLDLDFRRLS